MKTGPGQHRHLDSRLKWTTDKDAPHVHDIPDPQFTPAEVTALKALLAASGSGGGTTPVPNPPPPPPPPDITPPLITSFTIGVSGTSATLTATTNEASTVVFRYGLTTAYGTATAATASGTSHSATVTGLTAGRTYHVRAEATDTAGNGPTLSSDRTFSTPAPSGTEVIAYFPGSGSNSSSAFLAMCADMTIDAIEMSAATYHWRSVSLPNRSSRPLTVRPAAGATVIFDCNADGGRNPIFMGSGSHITFDGTAGRFRIQNTVVAQQGLLDFGGASFLTFRGWTVRNCAGNALTTSEQAAHVVYLNGGCHDMLFEDFDCAALQASDVTNGVYGMNGLQLYTGGSGAAIYNVTARNWTIDHANWATVVRNASHGLVYDGWTVTNCGHGVPYVMDFGTDNTGSVANVHTSGSLASARRMGLMTDGGGNSWA